MRIAHIADIHISEGRMNEFELMLKNLAEKIKEQNPEIIVFAGDLFIHRDKLTPKQVELAQKFFKDYLKDYKVLMIVGNHDITMAENKIDSLSAIFKFDYPVYTEVGSFVDVKDYRFHMFPYISKIELNRLGLKDLSDVYTKDMTKFFKLDRNKKNVLIYHGVLQDFNVAEGYQASEQAINLGKEQIISRDFWRKFDIVMAGHLHRYQAIAHALYPGTPFPLNYDDSGETGFVMWENEESKFIPVKQLFPYVTIDIGDLSKYSGGWTQEACMRLKSVNIDNIENTRVRIKYTVYSSQAKEVNHIKLAEKVHNAKEIKIVPTYKEVESKQEVSFEEFQSSSIYDVILKYIDNKKYPAGVKDIAKKVEDIITENNTYQERNGIHFKPVSVSLSNFRCFGEKNKKVYFNNLSEIIGIFGENRSGKSSFIEAIIWGLFGTTIRNKNVDSIIRNGQKYAEVVVEFNSYETKYKVFRRRESRKTKLNLYTWGEDKWIDISGGDNRVTQKNIEKIIGSFDMFVSTVYSPQNNIDLLIKKKPSERKQIILDCLQIDVLDARKKIVDEIRKEQKEKVLMIKGKLNSLSSQVSDLVRKDSSSNLLKWEQKSQEVNEEISKLNVYLRNLHGRIINYEELISENEKIGDDLEVISLKLKDLRNEIEKNKGKKKRLEEILNDKDIIRQKLEEFDRAEKEIENYKKRREIVNNLKKTKENMIKEHNLVEKNYQEKLEMLKRNRDSILSMLNNLTLLDCPKPDCPKNAEIQRQKDEYRIKIDKIDAEIEVIESERIEKARKFKDELSDINRKIDEQEYDVEVYRKMIANIHLADKERWLSLKYKIETGEDLITPIVELLGSYENRRKELHKEKNDLLAKRAEIGAKIASISKYKKEIEKYKLKLADLNQQKELVERNITECKNDLKRISELQKDIEETQKELEQREKYISHCNKYSEIVSQKGVVFQLIEKSIPIIEKFAQELLAETTNDMISIAIDSFRTLKDKKTVDEVVLYMMDAKGKRDVSEASGAELVLISLALRAAMSYLLSLRMGSKLELFIVDEGFGAFDSNNIIGIKNLLTILSKRFSKVMFITHVNELKDIAQTVISMKTNGLVSSFDIIHRR